jgi:2'-5' RNA ligase
VKSRVSIANTANEIEWNSVAWTYSNRVTNQRLFVAIDLPDEMAERLVALDPHYRGLTFSPIAQIHLTLAFFASVPPATTETLKEKLCAISFRSFFLPVTGLNSFSKRGQPHILWIGVGKAHPHLFQLHKRVNEAALACHLAIEERAWTPHFTIGRARGISAALMKSFLKKHRDFDAGMFRVEEFHLYQSTLTPAGSVHQRELTIHAT